MELEKHLEAILLVFDHEKEMVIHLKDKHQKIFENYLIEAENSINRITLHKEFYPNARKQFEELKYLFFQLLICDRAIMKKSDSFVKYIFDKSARNIWKKISADKKISPKDCYKFKWDDLKNTLHKTYSFLSESDLKSVKVAFNIRNTIDVFTWNKMTFRLGVTGMLLSVLRSSDLPSRGLKAEILKRTIFIQDTKESELFCGKVLRQELDTYNTVYKFF
eukprot:TRINITY_DN14372_c0_g1_i1.p1 TRINITY_DN14372_c0_g1~~TRINITY_DN14372_c0_g1_i1.p1  ORF type:complete len:220 (-),score=34.05 TRINITY_DN14372_c0_g1_i1:40-699(-)